MTLCARSSRISCGQTTTLWRCPVLGTEFDLAAGVWLKQTVGVPIQKETARQKENKSIFALLVAAGERLVRIIQKNRDCANKDIKKFTAEVNALCEKWDL